MSGNEQAYTGFGGLQDANSEWNRLNFAMRQILGQMATTTLALVMAVREDADGFHVDVQPMVAQVDGAGNAVPHGNVHNLPVWRLQGGTCGVIIPPVVGDIGLVVFASTDISGVKRAKKPTTPGSARRFDWADGIYLGGLLMAAPTSFVRLDEEGVTITAADGLPVTINAPGGLTINAPGQTVAIDAQTTAVMGDMTLTGDLTTGPGSTFNGKSFDTHTHSGVSAGTANSGPPV